MIIAQLVNVHPLAQSIGTLSKKELPDCNPACAHYQECLQGVIELKPFVRSECNMALPGTSRRARETALILNVLRAEPGLTRRQIAIKTGLKDSTVDSRLVYLMYYEYKVVSTPGIGKALRYYILEDV